ncbi:hypothetical protein [Chryseobacterium sp.]|uniref:hypothetical protein n=1 Tax=Chryseobacterium sp. TaxID=1871047 RepID=UPI00388F6797
MKRFILVTLLLIPSIFFAQNLQVDNDNLERNFAKWVNINKDIYSNLKAKNISKINFIIFKSDSFYEKVKKKYSLKEEEIWSLDIPGPYLKIAGGNKSPIVAYNLEQKISVLLFLPKQWIDGDIRDDRNCNLGINEHSEIGFITYLLQCEGLINIDFRRYNFKDGFIKAYDKY